MVMCDMLAPSPRAASSAQFGSVMMRRARARRGFELGELLALEPGWLLVDIVDQRVERGRCDGLLARDRIAHVALDLLRDRLALAGREPAVPPHEHLEPPDRIAVV